MLTMLFESLTKKQLHSTSMVGFLNWLGKILENNSLTIIEFIICCPPVNYLKLVSTYCKIFHNIWKQLLMYDNFLDVWKDPKYIRTFSKKKNLVERFGSVLSNFVNYIFSYSSKYLNLHVLICGMFFQQTRAPPY